ncbi:MULTISPECIES: trifunctional serine/threonine-protein kinase/ATP-binding protein/sensor histidine kinase [unclassified Tolypothrix]|uniref:trifunctional serine/threonine-protein kinase/ATP-binding protein/sensor histidine kinase n=1 Tax=unclassified Tolypothrix TaxID=2649714 RepID=UPI0005EAA99F|nr:MULTISPECIES: ATP-binding sensor histidine kinase [unclassified Tolypothrix]BAY92901.1 serine/threonine protein kinase with two-component sensor domain [Microchaete diplosiphon NIES-3275]EKF03002.1 ATPase, histidine kinase-, DNA gyrase B-, and HSP90-like domain protein [Tolypothrix sp. PCC 7601]MBE9082273.1 AAA family ATPase [Tolypothrix sp. LEGE 11397]UYD26806.1 AAA family ATPase [Tolypothrix sp. PCC 7712]UYD37337.1 AAA family ATPase [Tolypothrix sp. PCC 7601]
MVSTLVSIPGYRISEELYNGSRTLVYRAVRETDSVPVVIKLLKNPYPSFSELLLFRNQYTIGKNLNSPLIIQTYSLDAINNGYMLVMEDFGGISLKDYFTKNQSVASVEEFLEIAIALCDTLDILYHERIIHKDIKPSNILINPQTKQVKLIDFSIASLLPRETQTLVNPNVLEGTLAYISPEQTGRMNRSIDYRTDFYSLGVTFYELLTGELPFVSNDAMELVHSHLAKTAPLLHEINPNIPSVLSGIVSKLMAKNAEDRYQSALGLKFDLEKCLTQVRETGEIGDFEIASRDLCDRFIIPDKLYGRDKEVKTLLAAFERVSLGATEMMLVAGFSGIGKTAVVNEVHKPIVRQRGYFIKGKFDQFNRNIPFSAFVQAFKDLMGQLLTENDEQIQQWKNKILEAVGENGQVIIEVIPELENIIGEQPPAVELSGTAAENRFNLLFQKFTQVFTTKEHPLVIFLDDLQWADSASLKLIQLLMADTCHLLLIGAYRDNEVPPAHPLMLTLGDLQKKQAQIHTITLKPLIQNIVNHLVADTLKCPEELAWNISVLIYQKTQGNPFFATQFIKALHQEGLIQFDFELGCWQCDIAQVKTQAVTDDVVVFMSLQLQKLPLSTQEVLQLAACIGNSFDLNTLALVSQQSEIETASALWKALQEGLILPINDVYKFYVGQATQSQTLENQATVTYKFLHDRVQQAAYSLIADEQKQTTHLQIGRLLLQNSDPSEREERLFDIVNHCNVGIALITTPQERENLADLNLAAGRKAKVSTAYNAAINYLSIGIELLPATAWESHYPLTLALHEEIAEASYLNTNFEQMEEWASVVLQQAKTLLDTIKVQQTRILGSNAQGKLLNSVQMGLNLLNSFGIEFPEQPTQEDIGQAFSITQLLWADKDSSSFLYLPIMTDPHLIAAMEILTALVPPAYMVAPNLMPLLIFKQVELSIKFGNCPVSVFAYGDYGLILCGIIGDIENGYQFGELALNLREKFQLISLKTRNLYIVYLFTKHWKIPLSQVLSGLEETYHSGLETGEIEMACRGAMSYCYYAYHTGQELTELAQTMDVYRQITHRYKQEIVLDCQEVYQQTVLNLLGQAEVPHCLSGNIFSKELSLPKLQAVNQRTALCMWYLNQAFLYYLFGQNSEAYKTSAQTGQYLDGCVGQFMIPLYSFYDALIQLTQYATASTQERESILLTVQHHQDKLQHWANLAACNHRHRWELVAAEHHRVLGNKIDAIECYDCAIFLAKENNFIQDEALANELAAKFYLDWGKEKIAVSYMQEAYYCYARWGAKAKVADLEKRYSQLLAPILQQSRSVVSTHETIFPLATVTSISSAISNSTSVSDTLDLTAILKASQAISGEIELDKLLSSLLTIVIENAGADKCVLMLLQDNHLLIQGSITQITQPIVLQSLAIADSQDIPHKLIYKVKNNQQTVVLLDAAADITFANDPYIIRQQPQSILCMPILHKGKLLGILYLENNLAKGAFTSDGSANAKGERIELLNLICAQAAISLENARLYQQAQQALQDLQQAQLQIIQSEKMSALGNLVAGVAHEMNNPLGFIAATLKQAKPTFADIIEHLKIYQETLSDKTEAILDHESEIDLEYSLEDLPKMLDSMTMACDRLKNISTSLRTFSRADRDYKVPFNIHEGIDSTILILKHRLKANEQRPAIEIITNYGDLPLVECFPGQLNQVFMNILANAIDALEESNYGRNLEEIKAHPNQIKVTTSIAEQSVKISIADNAKGMSEEVKHKIFDHLFTTKGVGKGTGLGLAIAKQIVEEKHGGKLSCQSSLGEGTEFIIEIPV